MLTHLFLIFFTTLYAVVCLFLILAVLMQRSKQDGIGATFGSGFTDSVFGAQTSSVLVKFTSWLTVAFFVLSIVLAQFYAKKSTGLSPVQRQLLQAAAASAAPKQPVSSPAPSSAPVVPPSVPLNPVPGAPK